MLLLSLMRETDAEITLAAALPNNMANNYITKRVVAFLNDIDLSPGELTLRTHPEPSM